MQNKVVARFQDGRLLKGTTGDFLPAKPSFHLALADAPPTEKPAEVAVASLKAVFFVRDLAGDAQRRDVAEFPQDRPLVGRKIRVVFKDGETLVGTTQGYDPSRPGFFVIPADARENNERCFVVAAATSQVSFV